MSAEDPSSKDAVYEKQISEANVLGNALLSGQIAENINENKKDIKVFGGLINFRDLIESYRSELEKLKYKIFTDSCEQHNIKFLLF